MSDDDNLAVERLRRARRATVHALTGLCVLFALALLSGVVGAVLLFEAWLATGLRKWWSAVLLALPGAVLAWLSLRLGRCLLVSNPLPAAQRLSGSQAPSLRALIQETGRHFGDIRLDAVWITGEMNAAVLQRPRWGFLGPIETHLLIGLPLAHSVSERQFGAILAHEFGHLARQRRGLAAWGCHLRAWWFRSADLCIERLPWLDGPLNRLTERGVMDAQQLARIEEFEADRAAAEVVGAPQVAEALVEMATRERFLMEDFWVKVMAQCGQRRRPSLRPYRDMGLGMVAGFLPAGRRASCDSEAGADSLHPSLAERLTALGQAPDAELRIEDSVAERHLAKLLPQLAWELDQRWWDGARGLWRAHRGQRRRSLPATN